MPQGLTDEEMLALEAKEGLTDEEMMALEMQSSPAPRPLKSQAESGISGLADMLTFGHSDEIGAGVRGGVDWLASRAAGAPVDFGPAYDEALNDQRQHKAQAEEDNPKSYLAGNVAGAVIPAVATGGASAPTALGGAFKALTPMAGRGLVSNLGRGAAAGALLGAGQSNARPTDSFDKAEEFASDVTKGGVLGGGLTGVFGALGAMGRTVANKVRPSNVGAVMLGLPTEAAELYVKNPAAVNAAKSTPEITQRFMGTLDSLRNEVQNGSAASRKILAEEGQSMSSDAVADMAKARADDIIKRSEGILDDEAAATVGWLRNIESKYRSPAVDPDLARALSQSSNGALSEEGAAAMLATESKRNLSTNRVKDFVQSTGRQVNYGTGKPGEFIPIDDRIKKSLVGEVNDTLKNQSPAYAKQMKGVAKDTQLLSEAQDLAGSPQAMENLLKRVQRDRAFFPAQKIGEVDKRMGTQYLKDLKLSQAKDAFERGAQGPGGSHMVNLYKGMFEGIPVVGKPLGVVAGATMNKYGPALGKQILDATARSQELLSNSNTAQRLGKYAPILKAAMARGPAALVTANQSLLKDPEYRRIVSPQMAEEQPARP